MPAKVDTDEMVSLDSAGETIPGISVAGSSVTSDVPFAQPLAPKLNTASKTHSSMIYVETIKERQVRLGYGNGILDKIKDLLENCYWVYYVHLPFYLMTSFDAFCLHSFFLTILSFSIFGVLKYCLL
ncbi:hypothetical protein HG535_0A03660 [Zygotorulaspora mrakii]|uniref:Uncharacterized protein n=1 Tax=Zygotorulaspora mrakii TaxID=42260 RepID=A0A7H9AWA8_ZYGMR|nr:uncharacterized protein HG535_0A03660 [Zygotorulaspora mrakii]QLG70427.1 hypothetical protein HG535_0A03660 [Zygotorulaspora mrakii]